MANRLCFFGLTLMLPTGWLDISDDLPEGSPPTLGKEDGVGVIQFSVARYQSGLKPEIETRVLRQMLTEFGDAHGLGAPGLIREGQGQGEIRFAAGEFRLSEELISAWYLTNGTNAALVTYVTLEPNDPRVAGELVEASAVIAHLDFE